MKKKISLLMLTLGFLGCISAQNLKVIDNGFYLMPNPHPIQVKPIKYNNGIFYAIPTSIQRSIKANDDQTPVQVNFILDFDTDSQKAQRIILRNNNTELSNLELGISLQNGSNFMTVPQGTYDIITEFRVLENNKTTKILTVIREQVTLSQDLALEIASSEAKNHVHFQSLTIDSDPIYTGTYYVDDNMNYTLIEAGNTDDVYCMSNIFCQDYGTILIRQSSFGVHIEGENYHSDGGENLSDFFVNDVSDRIAFNCYRIAYKGNNVYTSNYEVRGATSNVTVTNDPTEFVLFEDPFNISSYQDENHYQSYLMYSFSETEGFLPGFQIINETPISESNAIKYYISASTNNSEVGYVPSIQPLIATQIKEIFPWGEEIVSYHTILESMPLTMSNNKAFFANNGMSSHHDYFNFDNEPYEDLEQSGTDFMSYPQWPTHPVFSYSTDKKKENLSNNCPILVSVAANYGMTFDGEDDNGNPISESIGFMDLVFAYIGQYGEIRPDEINDTQVNITLDGEELHSGQGWFNTELEESLSGVIDAALINETVLVDDMSSSNKALLHYTAGADDQTPPTMTMLHLKTNNGDVTNRFITADDGILEFSAGDFNFMMTPSFNAVFDRYAPEAVEVKYSPYGENRWNDLNVEEVPENYWPVMGWFYRGSLSSVSEQAEKGWFDLKIKLTDAADNWQEQVISPAFRIDDLATGLAIVGSANAHEVARYNLAGQCVDSNATGVVIVKMSDGTVRKMLIK